MMLKTELMRTNFKRFTQKINGFLDFVHYFNSEQLLVFEKLDLVLSHGCGVTVELGVMYIHIIMIDCFNG
jgi:hypothetical protein